MKHLEESSRGLGEVMAAVQRHFAKLHFAGEARNWDLARFEVGELQENLDTAAALRPEERGVGLFGIVDAFKKTQIAGLKDAIEVKDRATRAHCKDITPRRSPDCMEAPAGLRGHRGP